MIGVYDDGGRVLPRPVDERSQTSAWSAYLAADADLRTKAPEYADLAGRLTVREVEP